MLHAPGHSVCRLSANKHDRRWNAANGDAMSPNPRWARDLPAGALRGRPERGASREPPNLASRVWYRAIRDERGCMQPKPRPQLTLFRLHVLAVRFLPDNLVIHRRNHVDWRWSVSEKRNNFHLTAGTNCRPQSLRNEPGARLATVTEPRQTSKAKPPNLYGGLAKAARRSGMKAKVVVTQPFESRDNRAMALF